MILVDANVLIYAKFADVAEHDRAIAWLEAELSAPSRVGLPWPSLLAFLRICTNPRLWERPLAPAAAWSQVEEWLGLPNVWTPQPTEQHATVLAELVAATRPTADLFPDAHLAALAIEHGLTLCSSDGDFARFPRLIWKNPLAAR